MVDIYLAELWEYFEALYPGEIAALHVVYNYNDILSLKVFKYPLFLLFLPFLSLCLCVFRALCFARARVCVCGCGNVCMSTGLK